MKKNAVFLACFICLGLSQIQQLLYFSKTRSNTTPEKVAADIKEHANSLILNSRLPRLGFNNIHSDLTFLSFLQYFGDDEARNQSDYGLSPSFFESIVLDDPYYRDFYVFLSNSVSMRAAQPEKSVDLMRVGLASLAPGKPEDSYYIWRYKAVEELLFLGDSKAAKRSFETAAAWAHESSLPESKTIASISQQTADFLAQNPDSKAAQIGAWSSILTTALDDETRGRAIASIQALGGEVTVSESGAVTVKYAQAQQDSES